MRNICTYVLTIALASGGLIPLYSQSLSQSERLAKLKNLARPATHSSGEFLSFDSLVIKTDTIKEEGAPVEYVYKWTNIGDKPLTVRMVTTGCNCAVPSYNPVPVQPGESGQIKVTYHPKGHPGDFNRKVSVYTNLSENLPAVVLEIKGYVQPAVLPTWNFPVAMGPLLLKRDKVTFDGNQLQTERILCLNAGDSPLTIRAMTELLPAGLTLWCEPSVLQPGQQGDIVIKFKPSDGDAQMSAKIFQSASDLQPHQASEKQIPVILEGLDLPTSKRKIVVYIK